MGNDEVKDLIGVLTYSRRLYVIPRKCKGCGKRISLWHLRNAVVVHNYKSLYIPFWPPKGNYHSECFAKAIAAAKSK